jgi:hypothetical protein
VSAGAKRDRKYDEAYARHHGEFPSFTSVQTGAFFSSATQWNMELEKRSPWTTKAFLSVEAMAVVVKHADVDKAKASRPAHNINLSIFPPERVLADGGQP